MGLRIKMTQTNRVSLSNYLRFVYDYIMYFDVIYRVIMIYHFSKQCLQFVKVGPARLNFHRLNFRPDLGRKVTSPGPADLGENM